MSTMNSKEYIEKMLDNISTDIEVLFVANVVDKTEIKDFSPLSFLPIRIKTLKSSS